MKVDIIYFRNLSKESALKSRFLAKIKQRQQIIYKYNNMNIREIKKSDNSEKSVVFIF